MNTYTDEQAVRLNASAFVAYDGKLCFEVYFDGFLYAYVDKLDEGYRVQLNNPYANTFRNDFRKTLKGAQSLLDRHLQKELGFTVELHFDVKNK
jgi:hypothetical protein